MGREEGERKKERERERKESDRQTIACERQRIEDENRRRDAECWRGIGAAAKKWLHDHGEGRGKKAG